jgi:putative flippase GtrA
MPNYTLRREFLRFVMVGGLGFCIDSGLLTFLMSYGWDVFASRLCSFSVAVSATWLLNRLWTFNSGKLISLRREYAYYLGVQVLGAGINLSIFFILIWAYPVLRNTPLIPLAFGAIVSLASNYLVSKLWIFKR